MTGELLTEIIKEIQKIGFTVIAIVSNMGGKNNKVWNDLNVNVNKTYFKNPDCERNIWVFCDVPHLLKLMRNHLVDEGLRLADGTAVNKKGVLQDVKALNGKYILTARLNQDCLENFFSRVRGIGQFYDHPLPADVRTRIRLLILGSSAGEISLLRNSKPAVEDVNAEIEREEELTQLMTNELFSINQESISILPINDTNCVNELLDLDRSFHLSDLNLAENNTLESSRKNDFDCGEEALKFIAGFIAFKCHKWDKTLGTPTGQLEISKIDKQKWIQILSKGGLRVPSPEWLATIKDFEVNCADFHGNNIAKTENVMKSLISILENKFPQVDKHVISVYVRTRTFIRIRHMNTEMKAFQAAKAATRKAKKWVNSSVVGAK
uniref:Transposable element P transposase n=1 Tax=Strigamia maritima TaxID=126957 RepID=T1IQE0_STRMM